MKNTLVKMIFRIAVTLILFEIFQFIYTYITYKCAQSMSLQLSPILSELGLSNMFTFNIGLDYESQKRLQHVYEVNDFLMSMKPAFQQFKSSIDRFITSIMLFF